MLIMEKVPLGLSSSQADLLEWIFNRGGYCNRTTFMDEYKVSVSQANRKIDKLEAMRLLVRVAAKPGMEHLYRLTLKALAMFGATNTSVRHHKQVWGALDCLSIANYFIGNPNYTLVPRSERNDCLKEYAGLREDEIPAQRISKKLNGELVKTVCDELAVDKNKYVNVVFISGPDPEPRVKYDKFQARWAKAFTISNRLRILFLATSQRAMQWAGRLSLSGTVKVTYIEEAAEAKPMSVARYWELRMADKEVNIPQNPSKKIIRTKDIKIAYALYDKVYAEYGFSVDHEG